MTKQLTITLEQMENMGWIIEDIDRDASEFVLQVNTDKSEIELFARDSETGDLYETKYQFGYASTLEDLQECGISSNAIPSHGELFLNDHEKCSSSKVLGANVAEVLDMLPCELALYGSLSELNGGLYPIEFSDEAAYKMQGTASDYKIEIGEDKQVYITDSDGQWQQFSPEHFGADADDSEEVIMEHVKDWIETSTTH